ncbi:ribosome small subunit-dependent GTPase A [Pseudoalteromonas sp.]|uniref:ribosome small subunit-dependent GTPase A n=1 Tax=Pseudoalteromonas sp. TaxID=53249 RepID=UPI0035660285
MININKLNFIGWQPFFQQQLSMEEWSDTIPVRVIEQHRSQLVVDNTEQLLTLPITMTTSKCVVGDWLLLDEAHQFTRLLERKSLFSRKSVGSQREVQHIASNIDVAFIMCSLNDDFNLNRIERYLALVNVADCEAVIILTKADLVDDCEQKQALVQALDPLLSVEVINCCDDKANEQLAPWLKPQTSIVLLGSSGVGKSTLSNTLLGGRVQSTGAIREQDSKGRHTTISRHLLMLESGAVIIDTPGMRELQLADVTDGIDATFKDIESLSNNCKFADCSHTAEPACAVRAAIELGELSERRFLNYQKLRKENQFNTASLQERRAHDKSLSKYYKRTQSQATKIKRMQ